MLWWRNHLTTLLRRHKSFLQKYNIELCAYGLHLKKKKRTAFAIVPKETRIASTRVRGKSSCNWCHSWASATHSARAGAAGSWKIRAIRHCYKICTAARCMLWVPFLTVVTDVPEDVGRAVAPVHADSERHTCGADSARIRVARLWKQVALKLYLSMIRVLRGCLLRTVSTEISERIWVAFARVRVICTPDAASEHTVVGHTRRCGKISK